jgi:hypothetical protein
MRRLRRCKRNLNLAARGRDLPDLKIQARLNSLAAAHLVQCRRAKRVGRKLVNNEDGPAISKRPRRQN